MHSDAYHAFMLDHAAGTLSPAMELAGDLHVVMSCDGHDVSATWDMVADALLEKVSGPAVAVEDRRARACGTREPSAISDILATDFDVLSWRRGLSGVRLAHSGVKGAHLMRLEPGQTVPRHGHSALEATVVLQGALDVDGEVYGVGDLVLGEPGKAHRPAAHGRIACVCFVAREPRPFWRLT